MAVAKYIWLLFKVPTDRSLGLSDIKPFVDLLDVNIMVLSSKTGNKFCRVANKPGRRNIYLQNYIDRYYQQGYNLLHSRY
jgi:hypothetical protein